MLKPGTFPLFVSSGLLLFSLLLIIKSIREAKGSASESSRQLFVVVLKSNMKIIVAFVGMFVYLTLIVYVGFILATSIFALAAMKLYFKSGWIVSLITAVGIVSTTYLLFETGLNVGLPTGKWF